MSSKKVLPAWKQRIPFSDSVALLFHALGLSISLVSTKQFLVYGKRAITITALPASRRLSSASHGKTISWETTAVHIFSVCRCQEVALGHWQFTQRERTQERIQEPFHCGRGQQERTAIDENRSHLCIREWKKSLASAQLNPIWRILFRCKVYIPEVFSFQWNRCTPPSASDPKIDVSLPN